LTGTGPTGKLRALRNRRLDLPEVLLVLALAVLVTAAIVRNRVSHATAAPPTVLEGDVLTSLERRFGPARHSQGPEEWVAREFFNDRKSGVFLDVGAYRALEWSNTAALERDLNWSGVAIDAIEEFGAEYVKDRPHTRFVTAFVTDTDSDTSTIFFDPKEAAVSSSDPTFTRLFTGDAKPRQVRNRTLDSILMEAGITKIDYMSLDIELGEPAALRGLAIDRFLPRLVCVEAHAKTRQQIIDYFVRHGYTVVGRYLRIDPANLYFTPLQ
jgi:methyltransferase FkbM-like protein